MSVFEKPFSSLPEGENFNPDSDYVILYFRPTGEYFCTNIDTNSIIKSGSDLKFYSPNHDYRYFIYNSNSSSWVDSDYNNYLLSVNLCDFVYSTTDLYLDNSLYFSTSANSYGSVISETVSSSTILTTLKNGFLPLLSVVLIAVVGVLAFRKAFFFLRSAVRGA